MTRFPQDTYNNLGILVNNKCNFSDRINSACRKGNNTFYALSDIGSPYLNPLTIAHIYKTVVIPSMLYGCELWNNLSAKDAQRLHVFQHSVCKTAQTRSDICESLFGVYPISSEIDKRKLIFLGWLCLLNYEILADRIFLTRHFSFLENLSKYQLGFIPTFWFCWQNITSKNFYNSGWILEHFPISKPGK